MITPYIRDFYVYIELILIILFVLIRIISTLKNSNFYHKNISIKTYIFISFLYLININNIDIYAIFHLSS